MSTGTVLRLAPLQVSRGGNSVARIPKVKHKAAMIGTITIVVIVLGLAALLYFVFREHFASAVVALAALLIAGASLVVAVIQLFQGWSPSKKDASSEVVPGPDPNKFSQPEFPMTQMQRPGDDEPSANRSAGQQI
jgi:apolipoprotein N-acyltransferase